MPIVRSEDALERLTETYVGAGPYRIVSRGEGRTAMEPNPHWHRGRPLHDDLRFVVVRDDNTRALRLLAGAGDAAINAIPPLLVPLFERDERFEVRSAPGVSTTYLGFHTDAVPPKAREAIALAIDREALIAAKLNGRAHLAESWIPEGHWAEVELPRRELNRERARALLDEAGWIPDADGIRRRLILRVGSDRFRVSVSRAIAAMLAEVGLEVVVRPSESATLIADLNAGRFEVCFLQVPGSLRAPRAQLVLRVAARSGRRSGRRQPLEVARPAPRRCVGRGSCHSRPHGSPPLLRLRPAGASTRSCRCSRSGRRTRWSSRDEVSSSTFLATAASRLSQTDPSAKEIAD